MKHEMKPLPDVTLRYCFVKDNVVIGADIARVFREGYSEYPGYECVYTNTTGAYYAKCTRGGNIVVTRMGDE